MDLAELDDLLVRKSSDTALLDFFFYLGLNKMLRHLCLAGDRIVSGHAFRNLDQEHNVRNTCFITRISRHASH